MQLHVYRLVGAAAAWDVAVKHVLQHDAKQARMPPCLSHVWHAANLSAQLVDKVWENYPLNMKQ
jgi:hypothetical protein